MNEVNEESPAGETGDLERLVRRVDLESRRKELGLSLAQAAAKVGCTKPHLWGLEVGSTGNPRASILRGLRDTYGFDAEWLLNYFDA